MLLLIIFVLSIIFIYLNLIRPHQYWKRKNVPFVKPVPFFGNMMSFILRQKNMADWVQELYNDTPDKNRYLGFYSFLTPTLMIRDVELIKQIGIKEFDHFVDHRQFISKEIDPLFGKNLFSLSGQEWRHMRSTLSPAFTASKMRAMFTLMNDCAKQFMSYFDKIVDSKEPLTIEMKDTFTRYANDVIATTAFGITCNSLEHRNNEFYLMGKDATNFGGWRALKFFGYNVSTKLMQFFKVNIFSAEVCDFFRSIIKTNIASRENEGIIRPDMIHLLMEARKGKLRHDDSKVKDESAGFATVEESNVGKEIKDARLELSDDDITAQALLFFIAGFDTVSTAMCHLAYELAQRDNIQERLLEEIDTAYADCNGKPTYETMLKLNYLDMCISETLRKWPPVAALDRVCADSYTIQPEHPDETPVHLKKNDIVWFPVYALHRDPKYFPDPDKFDPERFSEENKDNINQMAYKPFGVGPRNCIGSRFALMEVKTIFFHVLSQFKFVLVEKSELPLTLIKGEFNMNAKNGFWLGLQKRIKS